jgi:hypothetical protein
MPYRGFFLVILTMIKADSRALTGRNDLYRAANAGELYACSGDREQSDVTSLSFF